MCIKLPLPIHVSLPRSLKHKAARNALCDDFSERLKARVEWDVVLIRKYGKYFAIVTDSVVVDKDSVLSVIGATGLREYSDVSATPCASIGWIWMGSFEAEHSLISFEMLSSTDNELNNYSAYLKLLAQTTIEKAPYLVSVISKCNVKTKPSSLLNSDASIALKQRDSAMNQHQNRDHFLSKQLNIGFEKEIEEDLFLEITKPNFKAAEFIKGENKGLVTRLAAGLSKRLAPCPTIYALDHLYILYPNFSRVLNRVKRQLALAQRAKCLVPFRLSKPILMVGPPGIGKTCFANDLAEALMIPIRKIDFSIQTASFILTGSSSQWSESKVGLIAEELIMRSPVANPMFILNEVDKVTTGNRTPINALLGLLDDTSKEFVDEFIGCDFPLDASHINYLLTANDLDLINEPLLTRVDVEWVSAPTAEQKITIGQNIYFKLLEAPWGWSFPQQLNADTLKKLAESDNPREMISRLSAAMGLVAELDVPEILAEHLEIKRIVKTKIGFY